MERKLERIKKDAVLGGVAVGMAEYFNIDKTIIRILWVLSLFLPLPPSFGWTIIIYVIMWVILPERDEFVTRTYSAGNPSDLNEPSPSTNTQFNNSGNTSGNSVKFLGGILLVIGAFMLLDEVDYWYEIRQYIWPVILIGIGAYLLLKQRDDETLKYYQQHHPKESTANEPLADYTPGYPTTSQGTSTTDENPQPDANADQPSDIQSKDSDQKSGNNKTDEEGDEPTIKVN